MHLRKLTIGILLLAASLATGARAAVIVTAVQTDGTVVFSTPGGSLNLGGLSFAFNGTTAAYIYPQLSAVQVGNAGLVDVYRLISGPPNFGPGPQTFATASSGDLIGWGMYSPTDRRLLVPDGYVSGDPLGPASATFTGSLASLGLNPGTYTWVLPSSDYVQLTIEAIPVPPAVWLFGSALGLLGWLRRRTH